MEKNDESDFCLVLLWGDFKHIRTRPNDYLLGSQHFNGSDHLLECSTSWYIVSDIRQTVIDVGKIYGQGYDLKVCRSRFQKISWLHKVWYWIIYIQHHTLDLNLGLYIWIFLKITRITRLFQLFWASFLTTKIMKIHRRSFFIQHLYN